MPVSTKFLFSLVAFIMSYSVMAQVTPVTIDIQRGNSGDVIFYAQNSSSRNFHIVLTMTRLTGYRCDCQLPFEGNVGLGKSRLFKLIREGLTVEGGDFDYRISFYEGFANPDVKDDISYVLPVASGSQVSTMGLVSLKETFGEEAPPKDFHAIGFKMNEGDKVYAVRRGKVVAIDDDAESGKGDLTYSRTRNSIVVRHSDNSLATYAVLRNNSFMVDVGDDVEAGDPLAVVGGDGYAIGPHMRLTVYYLKFDKSAQEGSRYSWVYVNPVFATVEQGKTQLTGGEEYTSLHTQQLIMQEWSKREIKKSRKK